MLSVALFLSPEEGEEGRGVADGVAGSEAEASDIASGDRSHIPWTAMPPTRKQRHNRQLECHTVYQGMAREWQLCASHRVHTMLAPGPATIQEKSGVAPMEQCWYPRTISKGPGGRWLGKCCHLGRPLGNLWAQTW